MKLTDVVARLLDKPVDCTHCGTGIWTGMQVLLLVKAGKVIGRYCSDECLEMDRNPSVWTSGRDNENVY